MLEQAPIPQTTLAVFSILKKSYSKSQYHWTTKMNQFKSSDEVMYVCPKCDENELSADDLRNHYSTAHLRYFPYACAHCPMWFASTAIFTFHFEREHKGRQFRMNSNQKPTAEAELDALLMSVVEQRVHTSAPNQAYQMTGAEETMEEVSMFDDPNELYQAESYSSQPSEIDADAAEILRQLYGDGGGDEAEAMMAETVQNQKIRKKKTSVRTPKATPRPRTTRNSTGKKRPRSAGKQLHLPSSVNMNVDVPTRPSKEKKRKVSPQPEPEKPVSEPVVVDEGSESNTGIQGWTLPPGVTTMTACQGTIRIVLTEQNRPFGLRLDELTPFGLIDEQTTFEEKLTFALWNCITTVCENVIAPWQLAAIPTARFPKFAKTVDEVCRVQPEPFKTWLVQFCEHYTELCEDEDLFRHSLQTAIHELMGCIQRNNIGGTQIGL